MAVSGRRRSFRSRWRCDGCWGAGGGRATASCCDGHHHARPHGRRRHVRSSWRRLSPLQRRRPLAGAAFREDALRQCPAGRLLSRSVAGDRPGRLRRRGAADARLSAPRHDRSARADSTAAKMPTAKAKKASSISGRPAKSRPCSAPRRPKTFCRVYDVTEAGNFEGRNILQLVAAAGRKRGQVQFASALRPSGKLDLSLFHCGAAAGRTGGRTGCGAEIVGRERARVRPGRDEKVLVSWNSLAIDALARAGAALDEPRYTVAANAAADFLLDPPAPQRRAAAALLACRPGEARRLSRRLCRLGQRPADALRNRRPELAAG